tara:strand:- start:118 stop:342 length:225 start_codon:yes stop_codon:yes gene_type:complete
MKLTQEKLIQIIKEEYQKLLNEKRIRLKTMDINFHGKDQAQLLGMKGRLLLTNKAARSLLYALGKEWGRSITGY